MDIQKNIFYLLGDWWASRQTRRRQSNPKPHGPMWLPTPGNAIFTLVMIGLLVAAQSVGALPLPAALRAPNGISTGTIAYQGRLADANGAPLTDTYNMIFRLYDAATGGTPLWEEQWTGSNGVRVSDGLFNVMLGSLTAMTQDIVAGHDQLFLGITIGTDDEMVPRVQLGSVPFAVQALTVPDGSVTTSKLADGGVTRAKLSADAVRLTSTFSSTRDQSTTLPMADGVFLGSATLTLESSGKVYVECNMTLQPTLTPVSWIGLKAGLRKGDQFVGPGEWAYAGTRSDGFTSWTASGIVTVPDGGIWTAQCQLHSALAGPVVHTYNITAFQIE